MGRPALFSSDQILDGARDLLLTQGVACLSVTAVAESLGAPSGSIYHRFATREHLVASLWLRTVERFQDEFITRLGSGDDPLASATAAARWVVEWSAEQPGDAGLLALYRRSDLISGSYPIDMRKRAKRLRERLDSAFQAVGAAVGVGADEVAFAVAGIPLAAVRSALGAGGTVPAWSAGAVERAVRAVLCPPP